MMKLAACNPDQGSLFARACLEACREGAEVSDTLPLDWTSVGFVSPRNFSTLFACRKTISSSEGVRDDDWISGFMVELSKDGESTFVNLRSSSLLVSEASGILLSPQTLQKMGIFRHRYSSGNSVDAENITIEIKEATITLKMIGTLHLVSLIQREVDEDQERVAMELYFSIPRYLADGDILCVPIKSGNTKYGVDVDELEEITYRWYLVASKGGTDIDVTSPVHTKIIMSSAASTAYRHIALPDIDCTTKLMCMELCHRRHQAPNEHSKMVSGVHLWSHHVTGQPYFVSYDGADVLSPYSSSNQATLDSPLSQSVAAVLKHLSPALELTRLSREGMERVHGALSSSLLMVECRKGVELRRQLLLSCAGVLGVHLYVLDARFLWQYSGEGGKFGNAESVLGSEEGLEGSPDKDNSPRACMSSYGCSSSALKAVARAPCLLFIEGIDELLRDVRGLRMGTGSASAEDLFADSMRLFLADVERLRQTQTQAGRQMQGTSPHLNANLVLPVAVVESREALGGTVRALFGREVNLSPIKGAAAASGGSGGATLGRERGEAAAAEVVKKEVASFLGVQRAAVTLPPALVRANEEELDIAGRGSDDNDRITANVAPVYWSDIGGLDTVRREILDIIQLPIQRPDLFPPGCPRRRAALLYGAPGTGKTLVAKAVATECGMSFLSVKGPELLDMYVGESERNVREVFARARKYAPCVLFFDELDSLAPARGRGGDGGGVMDRVVAQLLTEMDSLSLQEGGAPKGGEGGAARDVFVLGATNRPDLLDPALLRPGRFDRKIYLSVCRDSATRENILEAQTRKLTLEDRLSLGEVADALPGTLTGADIGALVSGAFTAAQQRTLHTLRSELELQVRRDLSLRAADGGEGDEEERVEKEVAARLNRLPARKLRVVVKRTDLIEAAERLVPSVSAQELQHYERLAQEYNDLA